MLSGSWWSAADRCHWSDRRGLVVDWPGDWSAGHLLERGAGHAKQPADADDWQARRAISGHELSGLVVGARPANAENRRRLLDGKEIGRRVTASALGHLHHLRRSFDSSHHPQTGQPASKWVKVSRTNTEAISAQAQQTSRSLTGFGGEKEIAERFGRHRNLPTGGHLLLPTDGPRNVESDQLPRPRSRHTGTVRAG
jgi:hypothetical protein